MTKLITILIGCSLALAAGVRAEQDDPKKKPAQKSKPVQKQQFTPRQHTVPNTHVQGVHTQRAPNINNAKIHPSNVSKHQHNDALIRNPEPFNDPKLHADQSNKLHADQTNKLPVVRTNTLPAVQSNKVPMVHPNKQTVQSFHPQHLNFHAQPNSAIVSAKFNPHYRINGSQNWNGAHYNVFRSYQPQWHERGWWHSHHNHIVLIGGGWYFWNAGYWYPAWGYDTSAAYYPYDGPIYVGNNPTPLDQVVADVQTSLQEQGYYHGEVDGLVGPLTQEALAAYQSAQGLEATAAIDQPTLESLGLG